MKATVEGKELVIRIPLRDEARPSGSGKTLVVATTGGNKPTDAKYSGKDINGKALTGKQIIVGVSAYIKPE